MTALLFFFALWVGCLATEALRLRRWQRAIPLRVAVTGTRGKSSVVRMLAATLREDGWRVLAKTTGAQAHLILPDGSERPVRRRGQPSILEQVKVMGLGARLGVDAVVAEVMSVHPENHAVEGRRILRPHLVLTTNFRPDHLDAQGSSRRKVAEVLALAVPRGARVLLPAEEGEVGFARAVVESGATLGLVEAPPAGGGLDGEGSMRRPGPEPFGPFVANLSLVRAAARALGASDSAIREGIRGARQDAGTLGIWRVAPEEHPRSWLVVNAFAANDPQSTLLLLEAVLNRTSGEGGPSGPSPESKPVGLLSLRDDRGDRSRQWVQALNFGALECFRVLYVHGLHGRALARRVRARGGSPVKILQSSDPRGVMKEIMTHESVAQWGEGDGSPGGLKGQPILFGFGNFRGLGENLVELWRERGSPVPFPARESGPPRHPESSEPPERPKNSGPTGGIARNSDEEGVSRGT